MRPADVHSANGLHPSQETVTMAHGSDSSGIRPGIVPFPDAAVTTVDELTTRMASGDEEAFKVFHDLYCDRLFRYLIVLCRGDEESSRDLLQIACLKVVRSIRPFADEGALWNWLAAIARNSFLDAVRRLRRCPGLEPISESSHLTIIEHQPDEERMLVTALNDALAQLPQEERGLIESFYFESGSYGSLALQHETSPKAIESRLARVRQKLRDTVLKYLRYENS
jgi:RNA polymerase sigma factor (sigma-70 family)